MIGIMGLYHDGRLVSGSRGAPGTASREALERARDAATAATDFTWVALSDPTRAEVDLVADVFAAALPEGTARMRVDFGMTQDRGQRFALWTLLMVLGPEEGVIWAERQGIAAFFVTREVRR